MKKVFLIILTLTVAVLTVCFVGCDSPSEDQPEEKRCSIAFYQTSINIDLFEQITVKYQLTGEDTEVTWESSDESVFTVKDGLVTPKGKGAAVLTAKIKDASASCDVFVKDSGERPLLTTNFEETQIFVGDSKILTASFLYKGTVYDDCEVEIKSVNEDVVKVENGVLKAIKKGTAEVQVTAKWLTYEDSATVNVNVIKSNLLLLNKGNLDLYTIESFEGKNYDTTFQLVPEVYVSGEEQQSNIVVYQSNDTSVATVSSNGLITAKGYGTTTVTAKTIIDGELYTAGINVEVLYPEKSIDGEFFIESARENVCDFSVISGEITNVIDNEWKVVDTTIGGKSVKFNNVLMEKGKDYSYKLIIDNEYALNITAKAITYAIGSLSDFNAFKDICIENGYDGYYVLTANIDFSDTEWSSFTGYYLKGQPLDKSFTGVFDGRGYCISNIVLDYNDGYCFAANALFGQLKGTLKNLGIVNPKTVIREGQDGSIAVGPFGSPTGIISNLYVEMNSTSFSTIYQTATVNMIGEALAYGDKKVNNVIFVLNGEVPQNATFKMFNGTGYKTNNCYGIGGLTDSGNGEEIFADATAFKNAGVSFVEFDRAVWDLSGDYPVPVHRKEIPERVDLNKNIGDIDLSATGDYVITLPSEITGEIKNVSVAGSDITFTQNGNDITLSRATATSLPLGISTAKIITGSAIYYGTVTVATMVISNAAELDAFNTASMGGTGYYVLDSNIDYANGTWITKTHFYNSDWSTTDTEIFKGTFDGRGYCISNLNIGVYNVGSGVLNTGFIGAATGGAVIKNVGFVNPKVNVTGTKCVPTIVLGQVNGAATVENVFVYIANATNVYSIPEGATDAQKTVTMVGDRAWDSGAYLNNSFMVVEGTPNEGVKFCLTKNSETNPIIPTGGAYLIAPNGYVCKFAMEHVYESVQAYKGANVYTGFNTSVWDLSGDYPVMIHYGK